MKITLLVNPRFRLILYTLKHITCRKMIPAVLEKLKYKSSLKERFSIHLLFYRCKMNIDYNNLNTTQTVISRAWKDLNSPLEIRRRLFYDPLERTWSNGVTRSPVANWRGVEMRGILFIPRENLPVNSPFSLAWPVFGAIELARSILLSREYASRF